MKLEIETLLHERGEIPPETICEVLRVNIESGKLYWRERGRHHFKSEHYQRIWNKRYAGKEAFTSFDGYGYRQGTLMKKRIRAHRVVWVLVHGYWPSVIDHINGARADNRPENLREVSIQENNQNRTIAENSASGCSGVTWNVHRKKWVARIHENGKQRHIGTFSDLEAAIKARRKAEEKFGFIAKGSAAK